MLTAITSNGTRVYQFKSEPIHFKEPLFCPTCHDRVILRAGNKNRPHFAHLKNSACIASYENESEEHLNLKAKLFSALQVTCQVELEARIKEIGQVADILLDKRLALEVQCSQLSLERLHQRIQGYKTVGIEVIWLLGKKLWLKKHVTKLQNQFLHYSRDLGYYYWELDEKHSLLRLKYMIHEDLLHHIVYLSNEWQLRDSNLYQILKNPAPFINQTELSIQDFSDYRSHIQRQLYFHDKSWLKKQELLYLSGRNLLLEPESYFWPFFRPLKPQPRSCVNLKVQLEDYKKFVAHYKRVGVTRPQIIYPPSFFRWKHF